MTTPDRSLDSQTSQDGRASRTVTVAHAKLGALTLGAFAVGALAIGRLVIGRAWFGRVEIDELMVGKLTLVERGSKGADDQG